MMIVAPVGLWARRSTRVTLAETITITGRTPAVWSAST